MTATVDRRIADRRRNVREAGARRRMRWVLLLIAATLAGGLVAWLLFESTLMAVSEVTIGGASEADVAAIAEEFGVTIGMPTISADAEGLASRIEDHPWVAAAEVTVTWPGTITITVLEHSPAAWVAAGDGWVLAAGDGSVLEAAEAPTGEFPTVSVGSPPRAPGEVLDIVAIGGVVFVTTLTEEYRVGASVAGTPEALTAEVAGHVVTLGHPVDMPEKARALAALLDTGLTDEAPVSLVSPLRPAVADALPTNPEPTVEGLVEIPPEPEPTG